ncbi:arabinose efflux permease family protein [Herbaspirillum sp. CF444]|uniref:MFS transporter n=1 Tax=Herbaspirillum sp. CF444 TaxID=1144319 RepID=UPI0002722D4C|nr:MFS transporter [Herbaspirillum sp. CF444]EJL92092.1 arabinose efflux permease family protein [Herbaspirillum sp. CF444]
MNSTVSESVQKAGMSGAEVRASASLASIFALRMLGLFLILPVFAVYAKGLSGGENAAMVGLAMGIYGLVQSFGQIPFGIASDKYGRKRVIVIGLILFALGAFVAAAAHDITWIIVGRAIQGAGAISAAVTALIADSTREEHRTKAMAMVGASIGLTFAVSLVASPLLYKLIGMSGIFSLIGVLALAAIGVVLFVVPDAPMVRTRRVPFGEVLRHGELMRLNVGVFALHMAQMAMFVVLPAALVQYAGLPVAEHWKIYLPVVLASFAFMLPPVFIGEKRGLMKQVFVAAISLLLIVQIGMWAVLSHFAAHWGVLVFLLFAFFIAFNILEACQPSLVSRIAPAAAKGTALGVYNTLQALGQFSGAVLGGWVTQYAGASSVFVLCAVATLTWLIIASNMKNLPRRGMQPASATA